MSPLRPWYCGYEIQQNGTVRLRLVWAETSTVSHSRDYAFDTLDELPDPLRDAVVTHRAAQGTASGTFDFTEAWEHTEVESLFRLLERSAQASGRGRRTGV